ncbi:HlyD family efflux transporter periplasmic adaptor subunit [Desulfovibrio sp. OttesenSCG-928-M16]|nr:HlyD family efflux transporter periplasmic adaptor subunit [Desulfovibrio sp. OttesenSCG-928-M16]
MRLLKTLGCCLVAACSWHLSPALALNLDEVLPLLPHAGATEKHLPLAAPDTPAPTTPDAPAAAPHMSEDQWQMLQRRGIVRVELKPARPRLLAAPFSGLLHEVAVSDGDTVTAGQEVARFDAQALEQNLREAKDDMDAALDRVHGAQGASVTVQDYARQELARKADALREAEERLASARLVAPVKGRVIEVLARSGQYVKRGEGIVELAEPGDMEIVCRVPSAWIARLKPGHVIWVFVDETAKSYEAEFKRFAGKVNSADKSIRAYASFKEKLEELLPGMSGRADFFPRAAKR